MAIPIINRLIRNLVGDVLRPTAAIDRVNVIKNAMREIRSLGVTMPSAKSTLAAFRKEAFGISNDVFNAAFKKINTTEPQIAKQQLYSWKQTFPVSAVPVLDVTARSKYIYKFTVQVEDKIKGEWSERWVTIGSNTKLTIHNAWEKFKTSYIDSTSGGFGNLYANKVDLESAEFEGVWIAAERYTEDS